MNTRDLEYLVAVAEELHFGRAAERCNASQPALSGQVRKLEDRLGIAVFERSKRHVRVTEIGARIVARARDILRQVQALDEIASAHRDPLVGSCVLGMPPTVGPYLTPLLLPAVKHYLPDTGLDLVEDFTDALETQLTEGALDIAVLATRPTRPSLSEIIVYEEPFWVAMPTGHALQEAVGEEEEGVDVSRIDPAELLLLSDGHCLRDQVYAACNLGAVRSADQGGPKTQRTSLSTILSLVGSGAGVTLVPAMSLSGSWLTDSGITVRRERSGTVGRTVRLVYRTEYPRMALVEKLADIIAGIVPDTVRAKRR